MIKHITFKRVAILIGVIMYIVMITIYFLLTVYGVAATILIGTFVGLYFGVLFYLMIESCWYD